MPERTDWLLRYIVGGEGDPPWVDRIGAMKGMFLFQHETGAPPEVDYRFEPYNYGPFTPEVYRDLESLERHGHIITALGGRSFRATEAGRARVAAIAFDPLNEAGLLGLRRELGTLGFRALLRRVYTSKPEFAARSIARDVLDPR